jgi:hypothetical protein
MPAYAKDGKVVCFFQSAHKFKRGTRRSALTTQRTSTKEQCGQPPLRSRSRPPTEEKKIKALVKKAVS